MATPLGQRPAYTSQTHLPVEAQVEDSQVSYVNENEQSQKAPEHSHSMQREHSYSSFEQISLNSRRGSQDKLTPPPPQDCCPIF